MGNHASHRDADDGQLGMGYLSGKIDANTNLKALDVHLTADDLAELDARVRQAHGGRMNEMQMQVVGRAN